MAGMKKVVLLMIIISNISFNGIRASPVDVSPFCLPNDAARKLSNDTDKVVCTQWVNGSKTGEEAITSAIKGLVEEAKATKHKALDTFDYLLNRLYSDEVIAPILGNCSRAFDAYVESVKESAQHQIKTKTTEDWERDLSAAFGLFHTCKEMVRECCPSCYADETFDPFLSLNNITLAVVSSASKSGHRCCETAIFDESYNSARFCQYAAATHKARCEKWVYGSKNWTEAMIKAMTNAILVSNATKPMALDSIQEQLASLGGVDPEPVVAACSQAFDAFVDAKTRFIKEFLLNTAAPISSSEEDNHFSLCKKQLLDKADLSLPEINRFDSESDNNIYETFAAISQAKYD